VKEKYFYATNSSGSIRVADSNFGDRLFSTATAGEFILRTPKGREYLFQKTGPASNYQYLLKEVRAAQGWKWTLTYQTQSDRRQRLHRRNGSAWISLDTSRFLYDGWNVVENFTISGTSQTLARTHTWGADLSGTLQGAGGVGGLLLTEEISSGGTIAYHFHYDGNGNVTQITNASGTSAATYRYDAFGNTLFATGPYAAQNRYRFSTKPLDAEVTNAPLYYYGYRYYDPVTGRWPSRDPIEERGGVNLYGFVGNDVANKWDLLGLSENSCGRKEDKGNIRYATISFGHPAMGGNFIIPGEKLVARKAANIALKTLLVQALGKVTPVSSLVRGGTSMSGMTTAKVSSVAIYQCCVCSDGDFEWGSIQQASITSDNVFTITESEIEEAIQEQKNQESTIIEMMKKGGCDAE